MADQPDQTPPSILERKLVTILSADVAEFSRLMGEDEEHTLRVFREHSGTFRALVDLHHGRIFNTAGDAILAEFGSPVEAVRCATDIQAALRTRNDLLPPSRQVKFRIGVNLGDVMMQNTDLMGDGVNVAARLQGAAEPGGICLSGSVYDQIRNKLSLTIESLGERRFKNISQPVRTFTIGGTEGRPPATKASPNSSQGLVMAGVAGVALLLLAGGYWTYSSHLRTVNSRASALPATNAAAVAGTKPVATPAPVGTSAKSVASALETQSSALLADATQIHRPLREIQALTNANTKIAAVATQLQGLKPADVTGAGSLTAQMKSLAADMSRNEATALARAGRAMMRDINQLAGKTRGPDAAAAIAAVTQAKSKLDDAVLAVQQEQDEAASVAAARQTVAAFGAFSTAFGAATPFYVVARRNDFAALAAAARAVVDNLAVIAKVSKPSFLASRARKDAFQTLTGNATQAQSQLAALDELGRGDAAGDNLAKINAALTQAATIKGALDGLLVSSTAASAVFNK